MNIRTVRFADSPLLGFEMNPTRSLTQGERTLSGVVRLTEHDSRFLKVEFSRDGKVTCVQYVPWQQVGTVLCDEDATEDAKPSA